MVIGSARSEAAQWFHRVHDTLIPDSFPDTLLSMSSSSTGVVIPAGPGVNPAATDTAKAAHLHYNADVGEDWSKVSVLGLLSASQPLPRALDDPTAIPSAPATPIQNQTEKDPTSLPSPPAISSQPPSSPLSLLLPVLMIFQTTFSLLL